MKNDATLMRMRSGEGISYDISKLSDDFTPFFRLWKTITKSLGKN